MREEIASTILSAIEIIPDSLDPTFHPIIYDAVAGHAENIVIKGEVVWYMLPYEWSF